MRRAAEPHMGADQRARVPALRPRNVNVLRTVVLPGSSPCWVVTSP
jgi:hypothetical protein